MPGGNSLWDQLIAGTGDAIADIREKLVEEPWFGRALDVKASDLGRDAGELQPSQEKEQGIAPSIEQEQSIDR